MCKVCVLSVKRCYRLMPYTRTALEEKPSKVSIMSSSNTTLSNEQHTTARLGSVIYLLIVGITGIIANGLVITAFWRYRKLRAATKNLFILNLAVCDIMLAILDTTFSLSSSLHGRWLFGSAGCVIYGFSHYFFISNTVSTLAVISVDRFYYITKTGRVHTSVITRSRAGIMICIVYGYTLVFTFPPAIGWNSFVEEKYFFSGCYIDYSDQKAASVVYSITASVCLFLVPLAVMVYCYMKIFLAVRKSTHRTISRQSSTIGVPGNASLKKKFPLMKRTHVQTAKMIVVAVFFSMIVWVPYVAVSLAKAFSGGNEISPLASHITVLIAKSCVIYNVLIYVVLNRKFKAAVWDLICCGKPPSERCFNKRGLGVSVQRLSRILSDTDRELPSQITEMQRSRLNTINTPDLRLQSRSLPNGLLEGKMSEYSENDISIHSSIKLSKNRHGTFPHKSVEFEDDITFENLRKGEVEIRENGHAVRNGSIMRNIPESGSQNMAMLKSSLKGSYTETRLTNGNINADSAQSENHIIGPAAGIDNPTTCVERQTNSVENRILSLSEARRRVLTKIRAMSHRQLPDTPNKEIEIERALGTDNVLDNVVVSSRDKDHLSQPQSNDFGGRDKHKFVTSTPVSMKDSPSSAKRTDSTRGNHDMLSAYKLVRAASQRKTTGNVLRIQTRHLNSRTEVSSSRESIRSIYSRNDRIKNSAGENGNCRNSDVESRPCSPEDDLQRNGNEKRHSRSRRSESHKGGQNSNKRTKHIKHVNKTSRRNSSVRARAAKLRSLSVDALETPPRELEHIQNYWKRMSLCLDDIDLDAAPV